MQSEWQPIETAPKDLELEESFGPRILGWALGYNVQICEWDDEKEAFVSESALYYSIPITHWMPLPEPPKEQAQ